jgi:hypothetical protein
MQTGHRVGVDAEALEDILGHHPLKAFSWPYLELPSTGSLCSLLNNWPPLAALNLAHFSVRGESSVDSAEALQVISGFESLAALHLTCWDIDDKLARDSLQPLVNLRILKLGGRANMGRGIQGIGDKGLFISGKLLGSTRPRH